MTETELIEGCLRQERTAQRLLYDRYKTAMYSLAYRITGDFDAANTALQDTFITVFGQLTTFRREATLGAWIKTILIRKAHQQVQKTKHLAFVDDLPTDEIAIDWGNEQINAEHLERAILSLPEGCRTIFVLAEVEGYAHREIAKMLNVSEGTSKSQLNYAKKRLREMLDAGR